jgi:hypothetical protein
MRRTFEVWFYIGSVLGLYGILLTAAGVYQWIHPPPTVLAKEHATFWAGVLLLTVGTIYVIGFWPKPGSGDPHDGSRVE